ncbi:MAG TPA: Mov34/MPN/PAD-1 family protein [Candidatus Nitrosocosmicus sp.]|nr:Mov34/MPN/PAD-1 family protein [Candidatus Nitrosocosmicus sp.]
MDFGFLKRNKDVRNSDSKNNRKIVTITKNVIDGIISYSKMHHPYEGILILEGERRKTEIFINNLVIPPFSVHGPFYSGFPINELPFDLRYVGTAHSHPSGSSQPSLEDLNHFYGLISIIISHPYEEQNLYAFDSQGREVQLVIKP